MSKAPLFCLAAAALCLVGTVTYAQTPPGGPLLRIELPDGKLVANFVNVAGTANREVPEHTHRGVEIGYVLEGSIVDFKIGDAPPKTINPSEGFVVPANTPHSANWGPNGMKGLAIMVLEKDKPAFIPVP